MNFLPHKPFGAIYTVFFFFIAMKFQKVSLTEPDDFLIYVKYVEKESLSDELKLRILKAHFKPDGDFIFQKFIFTDATGRAV